MYEIFEKLLKEKGVTVYRVAKDTGLNAAMFTSWKKGDYTPKADKLQKIADYFGVTYSYLKNGQEEAEKKSQIILTFEEESIIKVYRGLEESQKELVCQMLGIKRDLLLSKEA